MSYRGPKVKLSRRLGVPLTNKAAVVMVRKPYGPGQHGQKRFGRKSEFGRQLLEKQRLRFQYNVSERQMVNYYKEATRQKGNAAENLLRLLESRLDALVLRSGFAPTIYAARQLVTHGHIVVDGKIVTFPAFQLKTGQQVSIKEKSRTIPMVSEALETSTPPAYVEVDKSSYQSKFGRVPSAGEIPILCEVSQVVEYYSR